MKNKEALSQVELTDVCNLHGYIRLRMNPTTGREIMNAIIINRDAKLPIAVTKRCNYYENKLRWLVLLSEGENK